MRNLPIPRALRITVFAPLLLLLALTACDSIEERVVEHYERGTELFEAGDTDKAILELRNALKLDDRHVPSLFLMGRVLESQGDLQAAFNRYGRVADINPNHLEARLKLSRFYMLSGDLDQAQLELDAALQLDPNNADGTAITAALALKSGDLVATRTALDRAQALAPGSADVALVEIGYLLEAATPATAAARADDALAQHPKHLALYLMKLQILERMGDQAGIGEHLKQMIEAFPQETGYRQARAKWALRNEDMDAAEEELRAVVAALPENREAIVTLIRFLRQRHGEDAARAELTSLIESARDPFPLEQMLVQFEVASGRTEAAIGYLRDAIGRAGDNANEARVTLARLLISQQDIADASVLIDEILAEDPKHVDGLALRVAQQIDGGELEPALENLRTALNEAPEDTRLLVLAGRARELTGNLDLASDRFAKAVRLSEYNVQIVEKYVTFLARSNRHDAAAIILTEAIERKPNNAQLLNFAASNRIQARDWNGAQRFVDALGAFDSDRARQLKAAILIGQEQFDAGTDLLRDLPQDEARRVASIGALVQTYLQDGQIDEAQAFVDELIAENPENTLALGIKGSLLAATGEFEPAEQIYRRILEIDPDNNGAHSALARVFELQGDTERAEEILLSGLEQSPDNLLILIRLAQLREEQGRFDDAIGYYDRAYRRVPDSLMVANNLASLLADHRADDADQVERAFQIAGRLRNSERPEFLDTFAWTRYLKGEYDQALKAIQPVVEALPDNPWVRYHSGMILARLGRTAEAREHLELALQASQNIPFPQGDEIRATLTELSAQ